MKVVDEIRKIVCVDCNLVKSKKGCRLCLRNKQVERLRDLFFTIVKQDRGNVAYKIKNMVDFNLVVDELDKQPKENRFQFLQNVFLQILKS